jgi:hypothetical protein
MHKQQVRLLVAAALAAGAMPTYSQRNAPMKAQACDYSAIRNKLSEGRQSFIKAIHERPEYQAPLADPPASSTLVLLQARPNPLVHDAFIYHVAAGKDTGDVYVIQSGGYAGVWHVYGPVANIPERPLCPQLPPASSASPDAG